MVVGRLAPKRTKHAEMGKSRRTLKSRLFKRDGWKIDTEWFAMCAFGCGTELTYETATIDHWPIPRRLGGTLSLDNTRLACFPCNSRDIENAGAASQRIPPGLTRPERKNWWREQENNRYAQW